MIHTARRRKQTHISQTRSPSLASPCGDDLFWNPKILKDTEKGLSAPTPPHPPSFHPLYLFLLSKNTKRTEATSLCGDSGSDVSRALVFSPQPNQCCCLFSRGSGYRRSTFHGLGDRRGHTIPVCPSVCLSRHGNLFLKQTLYIFAYGGDNVTYENDTQPQGTAGDCIKCDLTSTLLFLKPNRRGG